MQLTCYWRTENAAAILAHLRSLAYSDFAVPEAIEMWTAATSATRTYGPWARRYQEIIDWSLGRKTMLVSGLLVPSLMATVIAARLLIDEKSVPVDLIRFDGFLVTWLALMFICFLISYAATRGGREGNWTVYVLILGFSSCVAYACWLFGSFSTLFMAFVPTTVLFASLIFDPRIGWIAFGIALLDWVGLSALEIRGAVPYAPAVLDRSINALVTPAWFIFQLVMLTGMLGFVLALSHASANLRTAQQGELRILNLALGRARDRLQRGNDLIRRYVPEQLAARLLGDDYEEPHRPERRRLTIFFSDLEGFTAASDRLDPEVLSRLLNEYLSEMMAIAEAHGGTVNQFVGDGIMILFGAPEATTDSDQALRAVRMSLAMQERMIGLREKWSREGIAHPFRLRVGINTGLVNVGNFGSEGRMTYTAIGRETNLAARLEEACTPDRVLFSHSTWDLVHEAVPCTPRGEIKVKGIQDPVRVYEVA